MINLYGFGIQRKFGPLWRVQTWMLERLISLDCASGDVRWAIIALVLRSFAAVWGLRAKVIRPVGSNRRAPRRAGGLFRRQCYQC